MITLPSTLLILLIFAFFGQSSGKIFEKCELATLLEKKHGMPRDEVKDWVCIAEHESTFNSEAINKRNWDGSWDHGLFQISNKFWCDDDYGKNVCRMNCTVFLDDDLADDLKCIRKIIRDTENWKGKGTGLTAWVAYVTRCQDRNLDEYMAECWSSSATEPENNIIPRVPDVTTTTTTEPTTTTTTEPITTTTKPTITTSTKPTTTRKTTAMRTTSTKVPPTPTESTTPADDQPEDGTHFLPSARVPRPPSHYVLTRSPGAALYKGVLVPPQSIIPQLIVPNFVVKSGPGSPKLTPKIPSTKNLNVIRQGGISSLGPSLTFYN